MKMILNSRLNNSNNPAICWRILKHLSQCLLK